MLTHTTTLATGLHPAHRPGPTVVDLARRPEQVLLDQLAAHAATGRTGPPTPDGHGGAVTAASRWAGHPTDPAAPAGPVALWQGAVVHAFLAAADLDRPGHHLDDPARWAVLSDTASLAQALAAAGADLPHPAAARPRSDRLHDRYARLALAAREVAQLAAPTGMADQARPAFPRPAGRVVIVTELDRLAPAIHQLARILTVAPASAEDLISVTRALAHTARAAATLAARAVDSPTSPPRPAPGLRPSSSPGTPISSPPPSPPPTTAWPASTGPQDWPPRRRASSPPPPSPACTPPPAGPTWPPPRSRPCTPTPPRPPPPSAPSPPRSPPCTPAARCACATAAATPRPDCGAGPAPATSPRCSPTSLEAAAALQDQAAVAPPTRPAPDRAPTRAAAPAAATWTPQSGPALGQAQTRPASWTPLFASGTPNGGPSAQA